MREKERIFEPDDSIQKRGSQNKRFKNESLEGGAIYGAEGGLRVALFQNDDPEAELPCICDLPEHAQDLIWEEIEHRENAKSST